MTRRGRPQFASGREHRQFLVLRDTLGGGLRVALLSRPDLNRDREAAETLQTGELRRRRTLGVDALTGLEVINEIDLLLTLLFIGEGRIADLVRPSPMPRRMLSNVTLFSFTLISSVLATAYIRSTSNPTMVLPSMDSSGAYVASVATCKVVPL